MKNIDKIRAMSAEELVLEYQSVRACEVCSYFEDDECSLKGYAGSRECNGGRIKWLNQEDNPIPKLECGDIVETRHYALVALDFNVLVRSATKERMVLNDAGEIERIWRFNSEGEYEVIWRADK